MKGVFLSLLLLSSHVVSWKKRCSNVEVQWQCGIQGVSSQRCVESLDGSITLIEHQGTVCQSQLRVNLTLYSSSETLSSNVTFSNANISQLVLGSPNGTQIQCRPGTASLIFNGERGNASSLMDIRIENITFVSCGPGTHKTVLAALFFNSNCQIAIHRTHVDRSNGVGLAIVDVVGKVSITWSTFSRNTFQHGFGGGVHLTIATLSDKTEFIHCLFTENQASLLLQNNTKGGGLYVQYRNESRNGVLHIQNCMFSRNCAQWGGGLLAMFNESAYHNTLLIDSTTFESNCVGLHYNVAMAGAGAAVTIFSNATSNIAHFSNCNFTGNVAPWGGGLMILSQPDLILKDVAQNSLKISGCLFKNNSGHIGAALHIYCNSPASIPQHCNAKPVIADSVFAQNTDLPKPVTSISQSPHSIFHIGHFPTHLAQKLEFSNNVGTPLHIHETSVTLENDTVLNFTGNYGRDGGAIMLYGSWIAVSDNNTLLFSKNRAMTWGGAIYSSMTEEVYLPYSQHCFIKSTSSPDPTHWKVSFMFNQNTANGKLNAIYATSVLPCVLHGGSSLDDDIRRTFCSWNNWQFGGRKCMDEIYTSPRNFSSTLQNMPAYPGIPNQHLIYAVDDYGHDSDLLYVYPNVLQPKYATATITNRVLTVYGKVGTNVSIQLELIASRKLLMTINVSLQHCPPAFSFNRYSNSCICDNTHHIYCEYGSDSRWTAYVLAGNCMTYSSIKINGVHENRIVFGQCPFTEGLRSFSNHSHFIPYLPLPLEKHQLDGEFCRKMNRTGILCGKCIANYSIDLLSNTFRCHNCSGSLVQWLIYITAEGIPPLIFFVIVLVLHISLTSGPLNGFIFFSHILSISVEIALLQAAWLNTSAKHGEVSSSLMIKVYSIWSLDFFRLAEGYSLMCLGHHVKVMHVLVLRYLSALYPLCFLVIAFTVIELHARNCRVLVRLWRPLCFSCARFRQVWKARTSIIDAFAAFILLSYVKIVRISLLLVTFTCIFVQDSDKIIKVVNYDPTVTYLSTEHVPFWCIAALCLISFGMVPPLLLTFYQFKFFQRCLHRGKLNGNGLRMFMDAFQGCYKDGKEGGPDRRYFAGFYFIFRLVIFGVFDLANTIPNAYTSLITAFVTFGVITAIVRPYKKPFFTYLDIVFFNLLAVIMALQYLALFLTTETNHLPIPLLSFTFTLIFIPLVYVSLFVLYWVSCRTPRRAKQNFLLAFRKVQSCFPCQSRYIQTSLKEYFSALSDKVGDSIPDRLEHSYRYRSL